MEKEEKFSRIMKNCHRYRNYGKEAKNAIKMIKKLEENWINDVNQTEQFMDQLVKICKSNNIQLSTLGHDISIIKSDYRKINSQYHETFKELISQLEQLTTVYNDMDTLEHKYKESHKRRMKCEQRSHGIVQMIVRAFSYKIEKNDVIDTKNDFYRSIHHQQSHLHIPDTFGSSGKLMDHKLNKLVHNEMQLERELITLCLNGELATVMRVRKLVQQFAENRIKYERNLITLFSQLDLVSESDLPVQVFGFSIEELENYFRPRRQHPLPLYSSATSSKIDNKLQKQKNSGIKNNTDRQFRTGLLNYKNQAFNKLLTSKSTEQPINQLNRKNLYYGSLCSLADKKQDKNKFCAFCNSNMDQNIVQTISQQSIQVENMNRKIPSIEILMSNRQNETEQQNQKKSFSEENLSKCNHSQEMTMAFCSENLKNIDQSARISPTASAPSQDEYRNIEPSKLIVKLIDNKPDNRIVESNAQENSKINSALELDLNSKSLVNQKIFCNECKTNGSKFEDLLVQFVNDFISNRKKTEINKK